jgi:hypothetical protein
MTRRESVGLLLGALTACRAAPPATPPLQAPASKLKLDPLVALAPAAGLDWLVELRPREVWEDPVLGPAAAIVVPPDRLDEFGRRHGGIDLRRVSSLVVAEYGGATLALARAAVEPTEVEAAFSARAEVVEGRAVDGVVTRCWGTVGGERQELALFGREAVGLERGPRDLGPLSSSGRNPLRAAVYFAQGRLKRALPALAAEPLAHGAALVGDAPIRAFAPGPFTGAWGGGLGGLLRAATAVVAAARPAAHGTGLVASVLLMGAWGREAAAATQRLAAAFRVLADDPLGRLLGINQPLEEPRLSADAEALRLVVQLDPVTIARGLRAATGAKISEIMAS